MSFMSYQMGCHDCRNVWTTAFGIVGTTQIATPTTACPKCGSEDIQRIDAEFPPEGFGSDPINQRLEEMAFSNRNGGHLTLLSDEDVRTTLQEIARATNRTGVRCEDCGAPYGKDGWCDVVIPVDIWDKISGHEDSGCGILCFRCMTKRLEQRGFRDVPVIIASGPYKDDDEGWRQRGWDHGLEVGRRETARACREMVDCQSTRDRISREFELEPEGNQGGE